MKTVTRISSLLVALLLLFTITGNQPTVEAQVTLSDNEAMWTDAAGEAVTHIAPNTTGSFFIQDADLESTDSGTATWAGLGRASDAGDSFNVLTGVITGTGLANLATFTTTVASPSPYNNLNQADTPLQTVTASIGGTAQPFVGVNATAGTFSPFVPAAATVTTTADFTYHIRDIYGTSTNRVKVSSESDPVGEWVYIEEVTAPGDTSTSATSQVFFGQVSLSSISAVRGEGDAGDEVWVSDGDLVTITAYDASGNIVDSDTITVDGVEPTVSMVAPADGTVTTAPIPQVDFEVEDLASGLAAANIRLTINDNVAAFTPFTLSPTLIRGVFVSADPWKDAVIDGGFAVIDSREFNMVITASDNAGNIATETIAITIDETAPALVSAETGAARTAVTVNFTLLETIDAATVAAADFTVDRAVVSSAEVDADNANVVNITLNADLAADAAPAVTVVGSVTDAAGNAVTVDSAVTATDGIAPGITITIDKALAVEDDDVAVSVVSDEQSTVFASINGTVLAITEPTPNQHGGTRSIGAATADASGQYGVAIMAVDGPNTTNNWTAVTGEASSYADGADANTTVLTLANGPIADVNLDGDLTNDVTVSFANNAATSNAITAVDAIARTVTLTIPAGSVAAGDTASVGYSYVADDVYEVDQTAPVPDITPAGTINTQSPFLRLDFAAEGSEYPGDSFDGVTLTKVELTGPDAVATDLLTAFVSTDNVEFLYAAKDLALGDYTLVISATDTAGNALTDEETDFTVQKRTVTIDLRPGWNLVSLPDTPADSDIASVINVAAVDIVSTYDAKSRLWMTAVRHPDEGWTGTLDTIEAGRGYWVHTRTFDDLVVDVPGLTGGQAGLPAFFDLVAGWNLVSFATSDLTVAGRYVDDYFSGLQWSRAYGFDSTDNAFVSLFPHSINDRVEQGRGYWVFLRAAGTLVP